MLRFGFLLLCAASAALASLDALHMLQLESYQLPGYFRWLGQNRARAFRWPALIGLGGALAGLCLLLLAPSFAALRLIAPLLSLGLSLLWLFLRKKRPAKKPFKLTQRAARLLLTAFLVNLFAAFLVSFPYGGLLSLLLPAFAAFSLPLAAFAVAPVERGVNLWYFRDAQRMLHDSPGLIKIGITGSYGKTSTKFILGTILSERYKTLVTPSSYNTPMGVTRVIREQLKPEHEVFVAEMGARHRGDIREMCELVPPDIGVLTSVGPQHLETFGSIETVAATKFELIEAIGDEGHAFFAADGGWSEVLYAQARVPKTLAGLKENASVRAKAASVSPEGSSFTLVSPAGEIECQTRLLGRHNVQNICLCAAVALHLGLSLDEVARGIAKLQPVEHRLQLLRGAGGVTVIDDAFNANPEGAKAALDVLMGFEGRRIVVTPGMVELGSEEEARNREFGRQMAGVADVALLIGKRRAQPILEGLLEKGFNEESAHCLDDLAGATAFLAREGRPGDVVLFENDLPDNY
ncbi:MAG: UDP-N-acetylmuramoyl-tripeptide--D-alanyl-D-alanine ligase [Christensenellaceae bacterium]|nr:UDP-N-acetylmuramoyl-tripeptide--D-alanyl-D-alanine ligase [Christensenellaceae bacterium]